MQITKRRAFHYTIVVICLKEGIMSLRSDPANLIISKRVRPGLSRDRDIQAHCKVARRQ